MTDGITIVDIQSVLTPEEVSALLPPCELSDALHRPNCDAPAKWVLHRSCCGSHALACDHCKDLRLNNLIAVECPSCGTIHPDSVSAYSLIEPM